MEMQLFFHASDLSIADVAAIDKADNVKDGKERYEAKVHLSEDSSFLSWGQSDQDIGETGVDSDELAVFGILGVLCVQAGVVLQDSGFHIVVTEVGSLDVGVADMSVGASKSMVVGCWYALTMLGVSVILLVHRGGLEER